jgi:Alcohol dehydrogenase GroES-associated
MKAVTWHGRRDVRVDEVPDPTIEQPTDAIIRVTSTAICGRRRPGRDPLQHLLRALLDV